MSDPTNPYKAPASTEEAAPSATSLTATPKTRELLGQAAPWLRFLTILGYIGLGLIVVVAVVMLFVGNLFGSSFSVMPMLGPILALVYLALAVVFYFPLRILGRMTKSAKRYKVQGEAADLEAVAGAIKGLAKFYGISIIVILAIYLVALIGGIAFAVLAGS